MCEEAFTCSYENDPESNPAEKKTWMPLSGIKIGAARFKWTEIDHW